MKQAALILFAVLGFLYLATKSSDGGSSSKPVKGDYATGSFESAVANKETVLVDFWATWCGPCKQMNPVVAKISVDYADDVSVYKVDVDQNQALARKYGIQAIPTFLVFKDGQLVGKEVGVVSKTSLTRHF